MNIILYLCFLVACTMVTLKFVVTTERFSVTETPQAVSDTSILININLKIKEIFILAAYL